MFLDLADRVNVSINHSYERVFGEKRGRASSTPECGEVSESDKESAKEDRHRAGNGKTPRRGGFVKTGDKIWDNGLRKDEMCTA